MLLSLEELDTQRSAVMGALLLQVLHVCVYVYVYVCIPYRDVDLKIWV